jgi:GR25 family glycosyltransferase involved in LPS biosynthesis
MELNTELSNIPIFYINLDHRTDRRTHMETQFEAMGIDTSHVERIPGIIPVYDEIQTARAQSFVDQGLYDTVQISKGPVGCGRSHIAALKLAYEREYPYILMLEDDFELVVSPDVFRERIQQLFADPTFTFDVCMLSYNMEKCEEVSDKPFLLRVLDAHTASGYLVARDYLPTLIACWTDAVQQLELTGYHWLYAIDMAWRPLQFRDRWYAFADRIGKQMASYSDNSFQFTQYDC